MYRRLHTRVARTPLRLENHAKEMSVTSDRPTSSSLILIHYKNLLKKTQTAMTRQKTQSPGCNPPVLNNRLFKEGTNRGFIHDTATFTQDRRSGPFHATHKHLHTF